jgi:hypothetical protein
MFQLKHQLPVTRLAAPNRYSLSPPLTFRTVKNASCGISTRPNRFMRFLPSFYRSEDAFARVFNPATETIGYLTYLGSDGLQVGHGIADDAKDNIYVLGYTSGPIFKALKSVSNTSAAGKWTAS